MSAESIAEQVTYLAPEQVRPALVEVLERLAAAERALTDALAASERMYAKEPEVDYWPGRISGLRYGLALLDGDE